MSQPLLKEIESLRDFQQTCLLEFQNPEKTDWYHKQGAWMGLCDALAEECFILLECDNAI